MLHNFKFLCPVISTYITNCYIAPARLAIIGGGTTQNNPTGIGGYALGVLLLIHFLFEFFSINHVSANEVAFADNFTITSKVANIKDNWGKLTVSGLKYGYFPNRGKSSHIEKIKRYIEHCKEKEFIFVIPN